MLSVGKIDFTVLPVLVFHAVDVVSHSQFPRDVRPISCEFILSRSFTLVLRVRSKPKVYNLPVKTKKKRTSWFSEVYSSEKNQSNHASDRKVQLPRRRGII